jgi:hypothetical protein
MILQVASEKFSNAHRITVALNAPTAPQTRLVVAVIADRAVSMQVCDFPGGPGHFWRCANTVGGTHLWHRLPGPQGGLESVTIQTANQQRISGAVLALETAGVPAVDALQRLSDMFAEVAQLDAFDAQRDRAG